MKRAATERLLWSLSDQFLTRAKMAWEEVNLCNEEDRTEAALEAAGEEKAWTEAMEILRKMATRLHGVDSERWEKAEGWAKLEPSTEEVA